MSEKLRVAFSLPQTGDQWVAVTAALLPIALVLGSVAFELVVAGTGLMWLVQSLFFRPHRQRIRIQPTFWPIVLWMTGILLSRLVNGFSAAGFLHDFLYLRYMVFFLAIVDISERLDIDRYLLAGVMTGIIWAALNTLLALGLGFDIIGDPVSFYTEKLHEGERIAAFSAYVFPFLVLRFISGRDLKKYERFFLCILIVLAGGLLFITKIRTAWLAAGIGIVGGLAITLQGRYRWGIAGGVAVAMIAGGLLMYFSGYQTSMGSMYDRYWIWQRSLTLWMENPVLGVGISNFSNAIYQLAASTDFAPYIAPDGAAYQVQYASHSHDLYLHLLSCTGIWGFLSFFWLVFAATRRWMQNRSCWRVGLGACPFVLLGIGFTGWTVYDSFYACIVIFFLAWLTVSRPSPPAEEYAGSAA
ncbi:MAG: O-antigen ligase family protein [Desulfocapsaceae bacterium]|nr:O-antigen ligase family protein [Desulfocapsaceae bacterium]